MMHQVLSPEPLEVGGHPASNSDQAGASDPDLAAELDEVGQ